MSKAKVLISDSLAEVGKQVLEGEIEVVDDPTITPEDLLKEIGQYAGLIVRSRTKVTREVIEAAENLKVIGRAGVGVDNIDLAAAQAKNITVINTPIATSEAVAELALSLMLALVRHVPGADSSMKSGIWDKKKFKGSELAGKTLGLIGFGNIGRRVADLANAFNMNVIAADPLIPVELFPQHNTTQVELDELYPQADIISLHVPLIPETKNLINDEILSQMKRGVYIVCTARGGIINETALVARLESGQVAGAALDVFQTEPPGLTALVSHPNVIATPHIGAQTAEAQERAATQICEEILAALTGKAIRWKVV